MPHRNSHAEHGHKRLKIEHYGAQTAGVVKTSEAELFAMDAVPLDDATPDEKYDSQVVSYPFTLKSHVHYISCTVGS